MFHCEQVLKENGIKYVSIHGSLSQKARVDMLREFRESGRDGARVLVISNVGSVGLNIACANILIIVVRTLGSDKGLTKTTDYYWYM
jgi:SNF2 family DNA or RNA helicase